MGSLEKKGKRNFAPAERGGEWRRAGPPGNEWAGAVQHRLDRRPEAGSSEIGPSPSRFSDLHPNLHSVLMATVRVLILRAPGANCDAETQFAFETAGAVADRVHVNRLREAPATLARYQVLVVPGGFTYGDDVAAGKI